MQGESSDTPYPGFEKCSPDVHHEAGTGRFRQEQIGCHETGERAGGRDSLGVCGVLCVKGRNETRLMSPLVYLVRV